MYFWKIEKLKEDIKSDRLTEKDRFIYALIYVVLCAIGFEVMMLMPLEDGNIWDLIMSCSNVLIVLLGTYYAYKANGAGGGNDFLGKYFSIGFVVAIRFLIYAIPLYGAMSVYYGYVHCGEDWSTTAIDVIPYLLWYGLMYWRLCVHMQQVNS